ncbi:hypothetical protein DYB36_013636 [Aphanomyces astaci]|uniref:DUF7769 domain-containing protein n=1 Tax=Aphanomyces astaci TaxID=112090 RepID=A0A396ZMV8_APHAT|nr:hypothetical protein DYB36_013636 [Aphanomyces astaci]
MPKPNLTDDERNGALHQLLALMAPDGTMPRGAFAQVAERFGVARHTIRRIWHRASVDVTNPRQLCQDVSSRQKGRSGRKPKHTSIADVIKDVPMVHRTSFASMAAATNIPKSTLHAYFKRGAFVKSSTPAKRLVPVPKKVARDTMANDANKAAPGTTTESSGVL